VGISVLVSILLGVILYLIGNPRNYRTSDSFVGGESLQEELSYDTPQFYKSFLEFRWLAWMYKRAARGAWDIYEIIKKFLVWLGKIFSQAHTGILHDYALWVFAGVLILLLILIS